MNGITFISINENISKHSYRDFGLILTKQEIELPPAKTYIVEIEGRNGSLDLSESFGEIKYENREIKFTFELIENIESWQYRMKKVAAFLHGQRMKIITWSDPNFYYVGRCNIEEYNSVSKLGRIVVICNCEPYKYKRKITTVNLSEGKNTIVNGRMTTYADLYNDEEVTIGNRTYGAGTHLRAIKLLYGKNVLNSSGAATLKYQEGEL
nr:MAG TPA: distal tail protein [Caudoviricetes sp.]